MVNEEVFMKQRIIAGNLGVSSLNAVFPYIDGCVASARYTRRRVRRLFC